MQILPGDLRAGAIVRVRRGRWRILDVRPYGHCRLVTLAGLSPPNEFATRRFVAPFDRLESIAARRGSRIVGARAWRRACRALLAAASPAGGLRAAARARIDLLPHQLEPALAMVRGRASRALLADDVGLGKTIQAGLVISELIARRAVDRVLILTPAGLRDQWRSELQLRFGIDATVVDARTVSRLAAALPHDVNPWTTIPVAIASIELVKRPEVLAAAAAVRWDLVIVDEAHGAAGASERHSAADGLCRRAAYALLITATPHSGDEQAFESLKRLGSTGDALLVFRRTRRDVGLDSRRRAHVVRVRRSAAERRMDAALTAYSRAVRTERGDAWLALSVLHKRALSSAWSLAESVDRRLRTLAPGDTDTPAQILLPLLDPDGDFSANDEAPCWPRDLSLADPTVERRLLAELAAAARRAAARESKIGALVRMLRRIDERAIVFTEYRDTLMHVRGAVGARAVVLHGGMTRDERSEALARFAREPRTVLLATDAAGEGLNLHEACRLVVNLELPWNPMRLEQRIGRVDRIGQRLTVHACHLVARATGEMAILDRLRRRLAFARAAVGIADPLESRPASRIDEERIVARLVVTGEELAVPSMGIERDSSGVDAAATTEARRLAELRESGAAIACGDIPDRPLILRAKRWRTRRALGSNILLVWRIAAENSAGAIVAEQAVPVLVGVRAAQTRGAHPAAIVDAVVAVIRPHLDAATAQWRADVDKIDVAFRGTRLTRERALAERARLSRSISYQSGLFDRRADRVRAADAALGALEAADAADRIAHLDQPIANWSMDAALAITGC